MVTCRARPKASFFDQSPGFFKVYLPQHSSQQLSIPTAFIQSFNGAIPDEAILKDLGGKVWYVELEEVENSLFMKNGWQGFVNDHSLELGDFLVFRYNGDSFFTVIIFGKNGCKKEEAPAMEKTATCVKIEEETETEAEETLHKHSRVCKRKCSEIGLKKPKKSRGSQEVSRLKSPRTASKIVEKVKVFEARGSVLPKNPFFLASISPSNRYSVNIPKQLLKQHGIELKPEMLFRNESGKLWSVRVCFRKDGRRSFTKGWMNFWKDNNLGFDDKCTFEFVLGKGRKGKEIRVQISRAGARTQIVAGPRGNLELEAGIGKSL